MSALALTVGNLGNIKEGATLNFHFTTISSGAPTTLAGTPVISVYKNGSDTQTTTGVTLTVDFDTTTGLHLVSIVTTDGFYSTGNNFSVIITTGTVGGTSVAGYVIGLFAIEGRADDGGGVA